MNVPDDGHGYDGDVDMNAKGEGASSVCGDGPRT